MLGDDGLRNAGLLGEGTDGLFALAAELFEDAPPRGVGEGLEENILSVRHGANPYPDGYE